MKILKKALLFLLIVFVIAQFFRPEKNQGDITTIEPFLVETNPPEDVKLILKEAFFDCHSDVTRYPCYNNITPLNFWLKWHIDHGKKHFNVSKWEGNSIKRKDHKLEELIEMVEDKSMPLNSYTWTHSDAKLTDSQIVSVIAWANKVRLLYDFITKPE